MEKFDSIILTSVNIGEYFQNNVFNRPLNKDELRFIGDNYIVEYRKKNLEYDECIKDLKEKITKIKNILEE